MVRSLGFTGKETRSPGSRFELGSDLVRRHHGESVEDGIWHCMSLGTAPEAVNVWPKNLNLFNCSGERIEQVSIGEFFQPLPPRLSFRFYLFIFRERGKEGEKHHCERKTLINSYVPYWGLGTQPRHVPWLGVKPATLWFAGQHSIHWATPARAHQGFLNFKIFLRKSLKNNWKRKTYSDLWTVLKIYYISARKESISGKLEWAWTDYSAQSLNLSELGRREAILVAFNLLPELCPRSSQMGGEFFWFISSTPTV